MNKNYEFHEIVISHQNYRTKRLHDNVVSFKNTYIPTYINPQPNKESGQLKRIITVHQPPTVSDCD